MEAVLEHAEERTCRHRTTGLRHCPVDEAGRPVGHVTHREWAVDHDGCTPSVVPASLVDQAVFVRPAE